MKISSIFTLCMAWLGSIACSSALAADAATQSAEYIYKNNCSVCHGDRGDGHSRASTSLMPPPRNFTEAGWLTREYMIATVTNGKPGTAMTAWKTRLSPQQIEKVVDHVRSKFMQEALDTYFNSGRLAYGHYCQSCHGERGQGVLASGLSAAPKSFAGAKAELGRERMIAAVTRGVPGTAMQGFTDKLSAGQIETVVDYVRQALMTGETAPTPAASNAPVDMSLPMPKGLVGDVRWGEQFFMRNCATCHGTLGDGQGPRAYFMTAKPRNFLDAYSRASLNRPAIFSAASLGRPGTEMPAWGKVLSEQEIANVAEFVFRSFISKPSADTSNK